MSLRFLADYQAGRFDLRYALSNANFRRYWVFSYSGKEEIVEIVPIKRSSAALAASIPDAGFFSREHHKIAVVDRFIADTAERFDIDGSWELGDFARFYGNVEDIYYIFNDIRRFSDPGASMKTKMAISGALDRPWRGGGSYVAYYGKVANENAPTAKLRVSGIKYNSPGYVEVRAKKIPFDDMITILQSYAINKMALKNSYGALHHFMSQNKLLKPDARKKIISEDTISGVNRLASDFDKFMPGISFAKFVEMSSGDSVVAAKVILSVYRRVERLYRFFQQGRVRHDAVKTDQLVDVGGDIDFDHDGTIRMPN